MTTPCHDGDKNVFTVGLAVGHGTGEELAQVFEKVFPEMAARYSLKIAIIRSARVYQTYFSMDPVNNTFQTIQAMTNDDVKHYEAWCEKMTRMGTKVVFRTAINAQSLYLIREHQQAVKVEHFDQGSNQYNFVRQSISRTSEFSRDKTERIIAYSLARARTLWPGETVSSVMLVYKFHLFDGVMTQWAKYWTTKFGTKVEYLQPDTANRNLLRYGVGTRQLVIAGNEWADIMHVVLLHLFGLDSQECQCTENVYLHPTLQELTEYQTVHGSADDIRGQGIVDPTATIRAAARMLAHHKQCSGIVEATESTLRSLARTEEHEGPGFASENTEQKTRSFLQRFKVAYPANSVHGDPDK